MKTPAARSTPGRAVRVAAVALSLTVPPMGSLSAQAPDPAAPLPGGAAQVIPPPAGSAPETLVVERRRGGA